MIRVQNLTFRYEKAPVLQDVSITLDEPIITGLWGRNGAGKTTLMKLLAGHEKPNEGSVELMGMQPYNNAEAIQHVCYIQEEHPLSMVWNVRDALRFGQYFNANWDAKLAGQLVETFRLDEKKSVTKLSKGMKSALQFIIGISSRAQVTIMDEPINGLDAGMRKKMYEVLRESHETYPRLIMLSTHHIEEFQQMCESIVVLDNGRVLFHEQMEEMRERGIWLSGNQDKLKEVIAGERVLDKSMLGSMMRVMVDAPYTNEWKAMAHTHGVTIEKAKLQDYLLNLTEEREAMTV